MVVWTNLRSKFMIYGITTFMFGARPNSNPSRPCAGLLKVDWYLHPPIFAAGGVVLILRVKLPVGFLSTGVVQILLVMNKINTVWPRKFNLMGLDNKTTCVFNLLHNLQGLGPSPPTPRTNDMIVDSRVINSTFLPTTFRVVVSVLIRQTTYGTC
jgi:hypothetical protein